MLTLTTLFNIVLEVLMIAITEENKIKYTDIGRKEVELPLYADYKILHIEYPIDYIRTLLKKDKQTQQGSRIQD